MEGKSYKLVEVWDPVLRILHWWNASAISVMILTGSVFMFAGDGLDKPVYDALFTVHTTTGFLFGAGIMVRIIWLFIGPKEARLGDMLPFSAPQRKVFIDTIKFYLGALRGKAPLYKAHNSFAGPIYLGFLTLASIQVASGAITMSIAEDLRDGSPSLEVHETVFVLIIFFIAAHLTAVFVHELVERHALVSAMINGKKIFTEEEAAKVERQNDHK